MARESADAWATHNAWKKAVLSDESVRVGEVDTKAQYLYRAGQLLVSSEHKDAVVDELERQGAQVEVEDPGAGIGVQLIRVQELKVPETLEHLEQQGFGPEVCQLNHVLTGLHGNAHGPPSKLEKAQLPRPCPSLSPTKHAVVAVLDTGVVHDGHQVAHPELHGCVEVPDPVGDADLPDTDAAGNIAYEAGHGTFMAGIIRQMDPAVRILARRIMDSNGVTDDLTVATSIMDVLDSNPDVINLSLGGPTRGNVEPLAIKAALPQATGSGVLLVAPTGNIADHTDSDHDGDYDVDRPLWPAAFPEVIGVAALRTSFKDLPAPLEAHEDLQVAEYSSITPFSDVAALGYWTSFTGTGEGWTMGGIDFEGVARLKGSSCAAAAVSGALSKIISDKLAGGATGDTEPGEEALNELRSKQHQFHEIRSL